MNQPVPTAAMLHETAQERSMPPGRDNIPADHQRRIALIYHLSERELAHESVEVRQLCRDYRDKLHASEKQAKIERGDMVVKLRELLQQMLDVAENADETGYVTDVGFVDLDKLHAEVRAALNP